MVAKLQSRALRRSFICAFLLGLPDPSPCKFLVICGSLWLRWSIFLHLKTLFEGKGKRGSLGGTSAHGHSCDGQAACQDLVEVLVALPAQAVRSIGVTLGSACNPLCSWHYLQHAWVFPLKWLQKIDVWTSGLKANVPCPCSWTSSVFCTIPFSQTHHNEHFAECLLRSLRCVLLSQQKFTGHSRRGISQGRASLSNVCLFIATIFLFEHLKALNKVLIEKEKSLATLKIRNFIHISLNSVNATIICMLLGNYLSEQLFK